MKRKIQKKPLVAQPNLQTNIYCNPAKIINKKIKPKVQDKDTISNSQKTKTIVENQTKIETQTIKRTLDVYEQNIQKLRFQGEGALFKFDPLSLSTAKLFETQEEEDRFKNKKIVAKTLISRDYGFIFFQEQIRLNKVKANIDRDQYKSLACGIVTETFRKIQHFLLYICERKIETVNHEELRCIFSTLLHFKLNFKSQQAQTLIDFICLTYNIREVIISEGRACRLYQSIQQILKSKMATKYSKPIYNPKLKLLRPYLFKNNESNSIYSLNKSWDQIHEDEMLEFYKSDQRFANMRTYFRQIHPQTADNYSIASLKSQFFRILRAVLKQISIFLQLKGQKNFPEMIKLDGQRIKIILRGPKGQQLRLKMLQIYKAADVSNTILFDLVDSINQYVLCRQKGKLLPDSHFYKPQTCKKQTDDVQQYLGQDYTFEEYLQATCDLDYCI